MQPIGLNLITNFNGRIIIFINTYVKLFVAAFLFDQQAMSLSYSFIYIAHQFV